MFAVIMAGGAGTRFWPVSRKTRPKQFLNITGKGPMVVETCNRLSPLVSDEEMILVLGKEHLREAEDLFNDRRVHILAETVGRNTAPCIGLGAIYAKDLGCDRAIAFLPADHFIGNPSPFIDCLRAAGELADSGGIVTIGIIPNRPETGYGYIRKDGKPIDLNGLKAFRVSKFVEKPDLEKARDYIASGNFFWNGGIFVAKPEIILQEIKNLLPELYRGLMRLKNVMGTAQFQPELDQIYRELEGISFDYGIMERTNEKIHVLPCECGWSDVGSWESLYELRSADLDANQNLAEGETLLIDCKHSFISSKGGRLLTCLGLKRCLVVDTPETILVADLNRSQDIKKIVEQLKKRGKEKLL